MNYAFAFALAAALAGPLSAQEATPKPARKTMTFTPGATTPPPTKALPAKPVEKVVEKAATTPKVVAKAPEKAPAKSDAKPAKK